MRDRLIRRISSNKAWSITSNPDIRRDRIPNRGYFYNCYKLHINIDPAYFEATKQQLIDLLDSALCSEIIEAHKYFIKEIPANKIKLKRQKNAPYTLFLPNEMTEENLSEVLTLCKKIENILALFPAGNPEAQAQSDLEISPHIIFRQASLKKYEYISAFNKSEASKLAKAGRNSRYYKFLRAGLNSTQPKKSYISKLFCCFLCNKNEEKKEPLIHIDLRESKSEARTLS